MPRQSQIVEKYGKVWTLARGTTGPEKRAAEAALKKLKEKYPGVHETFAASRTARRVEPSLRAAAKTASQVAQNAVRSHVPRHPLVDEILSMWDDSVESALAGMLEELEVGIEGVFTSFTGRRKTQPFDELMEEQGAAVEVEIEEYDDEDEETFLVLTVEVPLAAWEEDPEAVLAWVQSEAVDALQELQDAEDAEDDEDDED